MGSIHQAILAPVTDTSILLQAATDLEPTIVAFRKDYAEVRESATALVAEASSLTQIATEEQREAANDLMRKTQAVKKSVEATCAPLKSATHKLWKGFCALENAITEDVDGVRSRLEPLALAFDRKRESERVAEEKRLAERAGANVTDEILDEAIRLEAAGDVAGADALLGQPYIPAPVLSMSHAPRKMAGEARGMKYEVEVTDLMALVKAVAAGTVPILALQADMSFLKKQAVAMRELYSIPGTVARPVESLRIRA